MRLLLIICCALLAGCSRTPGTADSPANARNEVAASPLNSAAGDSNSIAATAETIPEISPTRAALFDLPEGTLRTSCAAADYYPDRQVPWRFYSYPSPPEFERYLECLLAEARRDGGRVRLASARSFPAVGSCFSARISQIGSRGGPGRPGYTDGTTVAFDSGFSQVDYGFVGAVARSRVGDPVRVCVQDLPEDCPGWDLRGIGYRTRNLRTGQSWTMAYDQHRCRGA